MVEQGQEAMSIGWVQLAERRHQPASIQRTFAGGARTPGASEPRCPGRYCRSSPRQLRIATMGEVLPSTSDNRRNRWPSGVTAYWFRIVLL